MNQALNFNGETEKRDIERAVTRLNQPQMQTQTIILQHFYRMNHKCLPKTSFDTVLYRRCLYKKVHYNENV